jgi:cytoskeletal protein CcmA (bactofilin family)
MWKSSETGSPSLSPTPEPTRSFSGASAPDSALRPAVAGSEQSTIGKSLVITGEISGSESLLVEGKVEGSINQPGNRVTVGRNGKVNASVTAREVVLLGKVRGNVSAADRVDIRSEGGLTGDVAAARISIEDGAFFKGGIDIRKSETRPAAHGVAIPANHEAPKAVLQ